MTDLVHWPRLVLRPRDIAINPAPTTTSGPVSLSGVRQTIASPAAVWSIRYDGVPVHTVAQRLALRALAAIVEGRATPIILAVVDREDLRPIDPLLDASAPHNDGSLFDDGTEYGGARADIRVEGAVALGGSQMTVRTIVGEPIASGMHFSAGHRLYRVKRIIAGEGDLTAFSFWPPAREAIADAAELEWDEPVCKVRLVDDNGLDLALSYGAHGFPNVAFVEDPS